MPDTAGAPKLHGGSPVSRWQFDSVTNAVAPEDRGRPGLRTALVGWRLLATPPGRRLRLKECAGINDGLPTIMLLSLSDLQFL
jgi:hypothetical protein